MSLQTYWRVSANQVNRVLVTFLNKWLQEEVRNSPQLLKIANVFVESCRGGKRLRGVLVKLGYEIAAKKYNLEILKTAVACEIFQTAILAHDDIIDESLTRRGKPSIYQALGGDHYGVSQAIIIADIGFFLSVRLIGSSKFTDDLKNKAIASFANMVINTGFGESLELELTDSKDKISLEEVIQVYYLKTAFYTLISPLKLGAILGGADNKLLKFLEAFGKNLGIAFQIQDDILDIFGKAEVIGKPVGIDIQEGTKTMLYIDAYKRASLKQRGILDKYYGKSLPGREVLEKIRKIFMETGALAISQSRAQEYSEKAKKVIPFITKDPKIIKILVELSDFLVKRSV